VVQVAQQAAPPAPPAEVKVDTIVKHDTVIERAPEKKQPVQQAAQQAAPQPAVVAPPAKVEKVDTTPVALPEPAADPKNQHVAALPANATDADRITFLVNEIRGHFARATGYLQKADVPHVRSEFRDLSGDVRMMRQLYPSAAESLHVQQQVTVAAGRLVQQACPAALADTSKHFPPNFTCELLLPNLGRGRGAGRQNKVPGRPFAP